MSKLQRVLKGHIVARPAITLEPWLLTLPNVPKPMHGTCPRIVLGKAWWDRERQAAYASTGYRCLACGVDKTVAMFFKWLEGHEQYEIDYGRGLMKYVRTVPLCHACHCYIHCGRLKAMLDAGKISRSRYVTILQHGDRVLRAAGIVKPAPYDGPFAPWAKWRLVIGRKRYKGLFANMDEWAKYHEAKNAQVED